MVVTAGQTALGRSRQVRRDRRDHGGPPNSTAQMTAFVRVATMALVEEGALPGSERLRDIW